MKMRKLLRWRTLAYIFIFLGLLAFPYGPLFPWSPVHPGYQTQHFSHAVVLYPSGVALSEAYHRIDEHIRKAEEFHLLRISSRMTLIVCRDWCDFERFMPMIRGRAVAGATLLTGTVIYLTPKLVEKRLDPGEYIRHELSHAALHQNQGFLSAVWMARQQWLVEGLAVSFGEQKSYVTPGEFLERAGQQDLGPIIDPDQREEAPKPFDTRFGYQAWRYFLEHLIETKGRNLFLKYMTASMEHPRAYRALFAQIYGKALPDAILQFQENIRVNRWKPNPDFVAAYMR